MTEIESREPAPRRGFPGLLDRATRLLALVSGVLAGTMMMITVIDVGGRTFFNKPLIGAFELTELLMACIVFLALPAVTWGRDHVTVTVGYEHFSPRAQSLTTAAGEIVAAITCFILSWRAWLYGERLLNVGERTLELGVPRGLVPSGVAVILVVLGILFTLLAFRALFLGERAPA